MKNRIGFILILMLLSVHISANERTKTMEGTTIGSHGKNGAFNLSYTTQEVEVGKESEVSLTLTTSFIEGELNVKLLSLDEDLEGLNTELLTFYPSPEEKSFLINLKLSSLTEGKHYLDVHVSMKDKGGRVFVVPITVGNLVPAVLSSKVKTTSTNELVSVGKAEETIR